MSVLLSLGQLLPGFVRYRDLGGADVLDLDGCGAFNVAVVAVEADRAGNFVFVFGELAVLEPELRRAFGIGGRGWALAAGARSRKTQPHFGPFFRQVCRKAITVFPNLL